MYIFKEKERLKKYLDDVGFPGRTVGYVPTMGALHNGHLRLAKKAVSENDIAVSTIFVNPTQFNDVQDFNKYPVQLDTDIRKLLDAGITVLYLPEVKEVYPDGMQQLERYDFGFLETVAEGAFRPGHFQGVAQVLSRFLAVIHPDKLYMGQKDYQQLLITRKLVALLRLPTAVVEVPTQREGDGLAMSSRNARLSDAGRAAAPALYQSLCMIRDQQAHYSFPELRQKAINDLENKGLQVEYLMLADKNTLQPVESFSDRPQVLLAAAWLDGVRLIDNTFLL